jgi:hypothetical protein
MIRNTLLLLGAIMLIAGAAFGDWDPSIPAKWVQMPDESPLGIDVNASYEFILADDFECRETGPITDIHIWGSWFDDALPVNGPDDVVFTLSLHYDIPQGPGGYSQPGDVIQVWQFGPGDFTARVWLDGVNEGWMDPPDDYIPNADWTIWQYNFHIPESQQFVQEGTPENPVVYWLDVKAEPLGAGALFGWKTSVDHWNDDAVWGDGVEPYFGPWYELIYPPGHEYGGTSIDLAFVIVSEEQEADWGDAPDGPYPTLAVSNGAYHLLGGPWLGDDFDAPDSEPDGQPDGAALGDDTYDLNDDEDGVNIPILVAGTSQFITVEINDGGSGTGGYLDAWFDFDGSGAWDAAEQVYSGTLSDGVWSIPVSTPAGAVLGQTFARFRVSLLGGHGPDGPAPDGEVEDHEVRIIQEDTYKWIQYPDLTDNGIDVHATEPFILADDFLCTEPGRITEIWVWGSWYDDYLPQGDPLAVDFILSFHMDIPADQNPDGYSIPGDVLWHRPFIAGEFEATMEATNLMEGYMWPPDEFIWPGDYTCWLYKFYVPPDQAFFQWGTEDEPMIFWLDVQAFPQDPTAQFGWKTSRDHWNDDAVWGDGSEPYFGPWFELRYPPMHEFAGQSIDLAFRLTNDAESGVPDESRHDRFGLMPNEPNPFTGTTTLRYSLATGGNARLEVFNVMGQVVSTLVDALQAAGPHSATWSGLDDQGRELPAGIYFCRLTVGSESATQKMMYLK